MTGDDGRKQWAYRKTHSWHIPCAFTLLFDVGLPSAGFNRVAIGTEAAQQAERDRGRHRVQPAHESAEAELVEAPIES